VKKKQFKTTREDEMNRLTIAGTVEKTVYQVGNSDKVGEFLIRVADKVYNKDTRKSEEGYSFLPVKVFGKSLEAARKHLSRGSRCFVTGKLEGREYNGKYYTSVVAEEVFPLVGGEAGQAPRAGSQDAPHQVGAPSWATEDDIPF
jgi:single-stranded DNA-binding protein